MTLWYVSTWQLIFGACVSINRQIYSLFVNPWASTCLCIERVVDITVMFFLLSPFERFYDLHGLSLFLQHANLGRMKHGYGIGKFVFFFSKIDMTRVCPKLSDKQKNIICLLWSHFQFSLLLFLSHFIHSILFCICSLFPSAPDFRSFNFFHFFPFLFLPQIVIVLKPFRINS